MKDLKELYEKRQVFAEYNSPIPEELAEKIRKAESKISSEISERVIGYLPEELDMPTGCSVVIGVEYNDGKLVKTASTLNANLEDMFENVEDVKEEDIDDPDERKRSKSIGFTVKFADGKIIRQSTAQRTMIEALRYMGLERASKFRDEMFKGFPLIGKEQRKTDGRQWQRMVDGWWVYIIMGNERKITCLNGVAKMLNITLEIISDDEKDIMEQEKDTRRRTMYSLNGSAPMPKNRTVWETVRWYLESEAPTFEEIKSTFPSSLQGSYGVIKSIEEINERSLRNKTERNRWFLDEDEILESVDGISFAVSNEWGNNFNAFIEYAKNVLNFSICEC